MTSPGYDVITAHRKKLIKIKGKVMTPITKRPIPNGMQLDWDKEVWNAGHAYKWSRFYEQYMECGIITVKPKQSLADAWYARFNEPMFADGEIFFVKD